MKRDWLEDLLVEWGRWMAGGGLQGSVAPMWFDPREGGGKTPGSYADPVMRDVEKSHKGNAVVSTVLGWQTPERREAIHLRYVGEKVAKTTKIIFGESKLEGAGKFPCKVSMEAPLLTEYSGPLAPERVAQILGKELDAVERTLRRARRQLARDLHTLSKMRKGQIGEVLRAA